MRSRRSATSSAPGQCVFESCDDVHRAGLAARDLEQQLRGALHGALLVCRIHAAFEALPGIGDQAVAPRRGRQWRPARRRRLRTALGGVGACRRVRAPPMTPAMPTGPSCVGDHQHIGRELDFLAIEQRDVLVGVAPAAPRGRP